MTSLLVTDLDGTVLGPDGSVPTTSLRRLSDVIEKLGLSHCVATSRSVHSVGALPLRPDWLIAHDGACVLRRAEGTFHCVSEALLRSTEADGMRDLAIALSSKSDGQFLASVFYGSQFDHAVEAWAPAGLSRSIRTVFADLVADGRRICWYSQDEATMGLTGDVRAVSLFGRSSLIAEARAAIPPRADIGLHEYAETRSAAGMSWLDVQALGVEKGAAVEAVQIEGGFDQVIALGNGRNDVEMLAAASLAIAPADACPEARAVATLVMDQGSEDGAFTEAVAQRLPELLSASVEMR